MACRFLKSEVGDQKQVLSHLIRFQELQVRADRDLPGSGDKSHGCFWLLGGENGGKDLCTYIYILCIYRGSFFVQSRMFCWFKSLMGEVVIHKKFGQAAK